MQFQTPEQNSFSVFSKCLEASTLTAPPPSTALLSVILGRCLPSALMSSQCVFAFSSCWICASAPHLLVQEPQGTRSLPSWEDITELSPGRPSAARFLSKEDSFCPDSNIIFPQSLAQRLGHRCQPAVRTHLIYAVSLVNPC